MYGANSFIMLMLVSRWGTVAQAGAFGIAFTTAQLLYIVGLFGVSHYQMTDYGEKYRFADYAKARVFSCVLMAVCCAAVILLLGFSGGKRVYTISLTALMMLNVVGDLYQSLFFQKNRLDLSGSALFFRTFWPLLVFCVLLFIGGNIAWAVLGQCTANLLITLYYALRVAPPFITKNQKPQISHSLIAECFPLFISMLFMNLLINASKYGIEFLMDDTAQGYYSMIFIPAQVINLCSQFIFKPLLNGYAQTLHNGELQEFFKKVSAQVLLITAITGIGCLAAYLVGAQILGFVYRKDLSGFSGALAVVILGGGIFALCQMFYYILVILRRQALISGIYTLVLVIGSLLTFKWIQIWGIWGAVCSFAAVHALILLCYLLALGWILRREGNARNHGGDHGV